jgi:hypothetical protein
MNREWWEIMKISDAINCKPKISLTKWEVYDFIQMASVKKWCFKFPENIESKEYKWWAKFEWWDTILARITLCLSSIGEETSKLFVRGKGIVTYSRRGEREF